MKIDILLVVLSFMIVSLATGWGWSQSPPQKSMPAQVYLLNNYQMLTATGQRVGDHYRLQIGREIRDIPVKSILFVGESEDAVRQFMLQQSAKPVAPAPKAGELTVPTMAHFTGKVQPILMNTCARCHCHPEHSSPFRLEQVPLGFADPGTTRRNAEMTARYVWNRATSSSPIVEWAITAHGAEREPPFPSRNHPAVRNLAAFVKLVGVPAEEPVAKGFGMDVKPVAATPPPAPLPASTVSTDPFNPAIFNAMLRRMSTK
jgi:hypothetical protein